MKLVYQYILTFLAIVIVVAISIKFFTSKTKIYRKPKNTIVYPTIPNWNVPGDSKEYVIGGFSHPNYLMSMNRVPFKEAALL